MNKALPCFLALVLLAPLCSFSLFERGPKDKKFYFQLLKKHAPFAYFVVKQEQDCPTSFKNGSFSTEISGPANFMSYIDGEGQDALRSLPTAVHETTHGYQGRVGTKLAFEQNRALMGLEFGAYPISEEKTHLVRYTETFPSKALHALIPDEFKANSSRVELYINSKEDYQSTQQNGAYGLLDEFNAYYVDYRTTVELYQAGQLTGKDGFDSFLAFYEFAYFIGLYLHHAQQNEAPIYQALVANKAFRQAYSDTYRQFEAYVQEGKKWRNGFWDDNEAVLSKYMEQEPIRKQHRVLLD